jgi:hypothetical protein
MTAQTLQAFWTGLPDTVRGLLRVGSTGKLHLLETSRTALAAGREDLWRELALAAFAEDPLDGELAMQLAGPVQDHGWGGPGLLQAVRAVTAEWRRPDNLGYYQRLLAKRDVQRLWSYLKQQLERPPASLFWVSQALTHAVVDNQPERALAILDQVADFTPLLDKPRADALTLLGRLDEAREAYARAAALFGEAQQNVWLGQLDLLAGDRERGCERFGKAVALQPWRISDILRLDEILLGRDQETAPLPGSVAVCLYSCNKAEELAATLESLAGCDLEGAALYVLDNGSTDDTPRVLDAFQGRFGDRMSRVDLPVNVGAAAARNWLASLDEVAAADFAVYLDDDAEPDPDFLGKFGAAVRRHPDAAVYGCKVADHAAPHCLQAVDYHLRHPEGLDPGVLPEADVTRLKPNPFEVSKLHLQTLDRGQFDYLRPCLSVTGCCHLFPAESLRRSQGFSLKLSPSQYDDFEHDLRLAEEGGFAVYQGHLRVLHRKRTGRASHTSRAEEGNALGNYYKLQCAHPKSATQRLMDDDGRRLEHDLLERLQRIDDLD